MDEPVGLEDGRRGSRPPGAAEIDAFALALAGLEPESALQALLAKGSAAGLRRRVFAPAARRLGDWWVEDRICFATVTLAMAHLQRLAWAHGRAASQPFARHPAMVLAAMPGEQHTFGLNLLLEDLRERGVEPAVLPCPTRETLLAAAGSGRFAVIGLSAGSDDRLAEVGPLALALRRAARGRIRIVLGGPAAEWAVAPCPGVDEILGAARALDRLCTLASQATGVRAVAA